MAGRLVALGLGALAGLLMAVQGTLNTQLARAVGRVEATFLVQAIGWVSAGCLLVALRRGPGQVAAAVHAPWYAWLGGAVGVGIVFAVVAAVSRLGVAAATTAILVAQILTAAAIDHFGLLGMARLPFGWFKLLGVGLFAAGAYILLNGQTG